VLRDLAGTAVKNLVHAFNASYLGPERGAEHCQALCTSSLVCQYWTFSRALGCFVEHAWDGSKAVPYPLVIDSEVVNTTAARSMVAGQYIQHVCTPLRSYSANAVYLTMDFRGQSGDIRRPLKLNFSGFSEQTDGLYEFDGDRVVNGHPTWAKRGSYPRFAYTTKGKRWAISDGSLENNYFCTQRKSDPGRLPHEMQWGKLENAEADVVSWVPNPGARCTVEEYESLAVEGEDSDEGEEGENLGNDIDRSVHLGGTNEGHLNLDPGGGHAYTATTLDWHWWLLIVLALVTLGVLVAFLLMVFQAKGRGHRRPSSKSRGVKRLDRFEFPEPLDAMHMSGVGWPGLVPHGSVAPPTVTYGPIPVPSSPQNGLAMPFPAPMLPPSPYADAMPRAKPLM
jgi:hypothetical protein